MSDTNSPVQQESGDLSQVKGRNQLGIIDINSYDPAKNNRISSPRSLAAMEFLFFTEQDLQYKDFSDIKDRFSDIDQYNKFVRRENNRITFHIEKIKNKREEIIKAEEKEEKIRLRIQKDLRKKKNQLSQNQKELEKIEADMKKEEDEMRKLKLEEQKEFTMTLSTIRKTQSMAISLKSVRPRIDNNSMLVTRSKDYFEVHSRVRQLKSMVKMSDHSKEDYLKARQLKDLESMISTELNLKV